MCKRCAEAVRAICLCGKEICEHQQTAINWLWENTEFPVGDVTDEQFAEMAAKNKYCPECQCTPCKQT